MALIRKHISIVMMSLKDKLFDLKENNIICTKTSNTKIERTLPIAE